MLSSKINFITNYNDLVSNALSSAKEFPDSLCDYLVNEFEFEAVVLLKIRDKRFEFLGKSSGSKKSLNYLSNLGCNSCKALKDPSAETKFETNSQCEFAASDVVSFEGCLHVSISDDERALIKIAKKSEFTNVEKDNLVIIGNTIRNLLRLWMGKKGGLSSSVSEIIGSIGPELRTPVNSILGFASLLNEESLSKTQLDYLSTLRKTHMNYFLF